MYPRSQSALAFITPVFLDRTATEIHTFNEAGQWSQGRDEERAVELL